MGTFTSKDGPDIAWARRLSPGEFPVKTFLERCPMGMRFKLTNIITAALAAIVACLFLLSGQVLAGSD
jgi:hypothetical protein